MVTEIIIKINEHFEKTPDSEWSRVVLNLKDVIEYHKLTLADVIRVREMEVSSR